MRSVHRTYTSHRDQSSFGDNDHSWRFHCIFLPQFHHSRIAPFLLAKLQVFSLKVFQKQKLFLIETDFKKLYVKAVCTILISQVPTINVFHVVWLLKFSSVHMSLELHWTGLIERKFPFGHLKLRFFCLSLFPQRNIWLSEKVNGIVIWNRTNDQPAYWLGFRAKFYALHLPDLAHDN